VAYSPILVGASTTPARPVILHLSGSDVFQALARGFDDFSAMRLFISFSVPAAILQTWSNSCLFAIFLCPNFNSHASNMTNRGYQDIARVHRTYAFRRSG
jgi:hypothetical protein